MPPFVEPFARHGHWTVFDNALVDTLLPYLPASSWAVLSVVLRQTSGWQRGEVAATHKDLAAATGMSEGAVAAALAVLVDAKTFPASLVERKRGAVLLSNAATRSRREPLVYRLNPHFRLLTSVVRRLREADEPDANVDVRVTTVVERERSASTSIFGVLSTSIFGALYETSISETKSGAQPPAAPQADWESSADFATAIDHMAAHVDTLSLRRQTDALLACASLLFGESSVPHGRDGRVEAGKLRQFAGSAGAALRLLFAHATVHVRANAFRYVMASASGARRDAAKNRDASAPERLAETGPDHLACYDLGTVRAYVAAGVPRERFYGGPRLPNGDQSYRYIAPEPGANA